MQRIVCGAGAAQPFRRLEPRRMTQAIVVFETRDSLGKNLNPAGRRMQPFAFGVAAKILEQYVRFETHRYLEVSAFPEFLELRPLKLCGQTLCARDFVNVFDQVHRGQTLSDGLAASEALCEVGEDFEVVACFRDRFDRLLHRDDESIAIGPANVVAFECSCCRQYDIRVARSRGPPRFMDNYGVGLLNRVYETIKIVMMVKGIAATPIYQPNVRVGVTLAVVVELLSGIEQQIRDPCDRNEAPNRIAS